STAGPDSDSASDSDSDSDSGTGSVTVAHTDNASTSSPGSTTFSTRRNVAADGGRRHPSPNPTHNRRSRSATVSATTANDEAPQHTANTANANTTTSENRRPRRFRRSVTDSRALINPAASRRARSSNLVGWSSTADSNDNDATIAAPSRRRDGCRNPHRLNRGR